MVKILHAADIHLDAPFSLYDVQKAQVRKSELRGTFTSLMMYAKMEKFDIVLLPGDIFDTGFATRETLNLMVSQFVQNPDCRFVIAPGNHDPLGPKSPYRKVEFPDNVYIFTSDDVTVFSFDDIGVDVYGWAFTDSVKTDNPLRHGKLALNETKLNILCAHADITNQNSDNCPISESDIAASGFDYVALGHIHAGGEIKKAGRTFYAYSGCLEGRSFDECGTKGAIICKAEKMRGGAEISFAQKRFSRRRYEKIEIDASGAETTDDVVAKIKSAVLAKGLGEDTLLRVKIGGVVSPSFKLDKTKLDEKAFGVFYFEYKDCTVPLLDYSELAGDITIRGAFFRELLPKLKSENEEERRIAAAALRYGLAALEGENIIDF
ncbi:MAG: DNA repair exonuclease [Clostridiales bacterium]|nr:DNA repair exonuclease [Clostridiales bacterium]